MAAMQAAGGRLLQPGVRPGQRRARARGTSHLDGHAGPPGGRRGQHGGEQQRRRRAAGPRRPLAKGREVIVSRGQAVEIGGRFRIPDVMRQSGCKLVEVGTTNRTRLADYDEAITPRTAALLHVHTSNFRVVGFTEERGDRRAGRPGPAARRARAGRPGQRRAAGHRHGSAWPTSPWSRRAWRRAPSWSASPATSCWAGRRPGWWSAGATWWPACAGSPSPAPCAWTSAPSPRCRPPCCLRARRGRGARSRCGA